MSFQNDPTPDLPPRAEMLSAFMARDPGYEGVFVAAVRTTGIFCRTTCPARKPQSDNVLFFPTCRSALLAGYRPCRRCRPMEPQGRTPDWLRQVLNSVSSDPTRRWTDADLRAAGIDPARARRWFQAHHGMTFHAYARAVRLAAALDRIQSGAPVTQAAFESGYESLSGFTDAFAKLIGSTPSRAVEAAVVHVTRIATPLGPMVVATDHESLRLLEFADRRMLATQLRRLADRHRCVFVPGGTPVTETVHSQLEEYFSGGRRVFDLPVEAAGTDFQHEVWKALGDIPVGQTRSYGAIADAIGRPTAVRAVARANGANPVAIVIPCHRVVGSDGHLTGYGGGLWRKRRLLELEGARASPLGEPAASATPSRGR